MDPFIRSRKKLLKVLYEYKRFLEIKYRATRCIRLKVVAAFSRFLNMVKAAGYSVTWEVLDAANFGVPQHRERVYIVGVLESTSPWMPQRPAFDFAPLLEAHDRVAFRKIMDRAPDPRLNNHKFDGLPLTDIKTDSGFVLQAKKNNYINNKLFSSHGIVGTLCATFSPIVYDERHRLARQMSPREMLLCQGFPATFKLPPGRSKAMFRQRGVCERCACHHTGA